MGVSRHRHETTSATPDCTGGGLCVPAAGIRLDRRPIRQRQPALHAGQERADGRRGPVGTPPEVLPRILAQRLPRPILVQIQLLVQGGRLTVIVSTRNTPRALWLSAILVTMSLAAAPAAQAQAPAAINAPPRAPYTKYKGLQEGKNADYIPALAKVNPNTFGIALVTVDGKLYTVGDIASEVSIQSISKVFTLAKVMEEQGPEPIAKTIGVDATGMRFNSIVAIE